MRQWFSRVGRSRVFSGPTAYTYLDSLGRKTSKQKSNRIRPERISAAPDRTGRRRFPMEPPQRTDRHGCGSTPACRCKRACEERDCGGRGSLWEEPVRTDHSMLPVAPRRRPSNGADKSDYSGSSRKFRQPVFGPFLIASPSAARSHDGAGREATCLSARGVARCTAHVLAPPPCTVCAESVLLASPGSLTSLQTRR
jgi:hypothetical protein